MSKIHLVIPDQHANPDYNNDRADVIGKLMADLKPDTVINMGDAADMASMSGYDKGTRSFWGKSYEKDINSHLDFQDRMWSPMRRTRKRMPYRIILEGNHEHRVKRAINLQPELEGDRFGVSFKDFAFDDYYQEVVGYEGGTPGITSVDGVSYAHYFISGIMGRPIGGEHHAYSLIAKNFTSCTAAHSHTVDWAVRTNTHGTKIMGLVAGVFQDYDSDWAGKCNDLWWQGVVICRGVEGGQYSPEFVSMERLKEVYT